MRLHLFASTALAAALVSGMAGAETRSAHTQSYSETVRSENGVTTRTERTSESRVSQPGAASAPAAGASTTLTTTTISRSSPPGAIYGYELMTEKEREELFDDLEDADDEAERQGVLAEHRTRMEDRARNMGVTLPEPELRSTTTTMNRQ
jgi:hypothetical protein